MKNLKMLGPLLFSALALVALVGSSTASATPATFTASGGGEALSATISLENFKFTVEGSTAECEEASMAGETTGTSSEFLTFAPVLKKCKAFGFTSGVTVTVGSCHITLEAGTTQGHANTPLSNCSDSTKGIQIDVNVPFVSRCTVDIPNQQISRAVSYTNKTPTPTTMDFEIKFTATGVMNDVTTSTGLCPLKIGTNSTGAIHGQATVTSAAGNITHSPAS